jgi:hypothetical protein
LALLLTSIKLVESKRKGVQIHHVPMHAGGWFQALTASALCNTWRTIQKHIQAVRSKPPSGQSWSTFLKTHGRDIWACDFVPVVTLFFKTLHAFVIVHHEGRPWCTSV